MYEYMIYNNINYRLGIPAYIDLCSIIIGYMLYRLK